MTEQLPSSDADRQRDANAFAHHRIAILTEGHSIPFVAKTAISLMRYRPDDVVAIIDATATAKTAEDLLGAGGDIPVVGGLSAIESPDAIYVGIAPPGGKLPEPWRPIITDALRRGMDIVSGLHDFLVDDEEYVRLAQQNNAQLIDVRRNHFKETGIGKRFRPGCIRIHAVGHDCTIGKMVAALELQRALSDAGHDAKFLATGQTGIMISGDGVPIDCVVADFVNGAAEDMISRNEHHDFLVIEGQGSISHPAYSAVTLGLLHGCAPNGLVYCYQAGRTQVKGFDNIDIPPLTEQLQVYESLANMRHPCKVIGIAVNTSSLSDEDAKVELIEAEDRFGLPACDVYRTGIQKLVNACEDLREEVLDS